MLLDTTTCLYGEDPEYPRDEHGTFTWRNLYFDLLQEHFSVVVTLFEEDEKTRDEGRIRHVESMRREWMQWLAVFVSGDDQDDDDWETP